MIELLLKITERGKQNRRRSRGRNRYFGFIQNRTWYYMTHMHMETCLLNNWKTSSESSRLPKKCRIGRKAAYGVTQLTSLHVRHYHLEDMHHPNHHLHLPCLGFGTQRSAVNCWVVHGVLGLVAKVLQVLLRQLRPLLQVNQSWQQCVPQQVLQWLQPEKVDQNKKHQ